MLIQLLIVGYVLTFVFAAEQPYIVLVVLVVMMAAAAWIALRPLGARTLRRICWALAAIAIGGVSTLALVTQWVLDLTPWYQPRFLVPLGGMTFSTAITRSASPPNGSRRSWPLAYPRRRPEEGRWRRR